MAVALIIASCNSNYSFREDKRVRIIAPRDNSSVRLPITVRWTVRDFTVIAADGSRSDAAGNFGVFIDRSPMAPGKDLRSLAEEDCRRVADCPDEAYLAERDIYITTKTFFRIDSLVDTRPAEKPKAKDHHEVTVVLLNGRNERIGESAFRVSFIVERITGGRT